MPKALATRRASSTAPSEQHPEWRESAWFSCHICIVRPTTLYPRWTRSAAATLLSTPPDIATRTGPGLSRMLRFEAIVAGFRQERLDLIRQHHLRLYSRSQNQEGWSVLQP